MGQLFRHARPHVCTLALACASACASPHTHAPVTAAPVVTEPTLAAQPTQTESLDTRPQTAPPAWSQGLAITSNAGAYRVIYRSSPSPIPRGEIYALEVWVFDARDTDHPLTDVALTVDASMPEHQHGMNRRPVVRVLEGGGFRVDFLMFHMPGRWELYFDVTRGAITERAQVIVELL